MVTALWQRAHRKSLGGGWVVDMGVHAHACNQLLDRHARFVKYFACNVARLGAGRDIGTDLAVWTGVAPAFPPADRLSTASAALPLHQPTMAAPSHASRLSCAVVDGRVASRPQSDCKHPPRHKQYPSLPTIGSIITYRLPSTPSRRQISTKINRR